MSWESEEEIFADFRKKISDINNREQSYVHMRTVFLDYCSENNIYTDDYVALCLFAYLGSWGMFRNSFIAQKDYKFHIPIVKLLKENYFECSYSSDNIKKIMDIKTKIVNEYKKYDFFVRKKGDEESVKKKITSPSDTLVSKILLGTFGCVPAYDQYVVKGMSLNKPDSISGAFNEKSLEGIFVFIAQNRDTIDKLCNEFNNEKIVAYTPARIVDIYFWEKGFRL